MTRLYDLGRRDSDRVASKFGGGFPRGSLVYIEGPDGGGKSVWSQRFTHGFAEQGYSVTYVSPEMSTREFIEQMDSLSYNIEGHLLRENVLFLPADVDTEERLDSDNADRRRELITALMDAETMWRSDVIILDGFDALLNHDPRFDEVRAESEGDLAMQNFLSFLDTLQSQGKTIILLANPNAVDEMTLRPLRSEADVYLDIGVTKVGQDMRKNLDVRRYSSMQNTVDDSIGYSVQPGVGIVIRTRTVT